MGDQALRSRRLIFISILGGLLILFFIAAWVWFNPASPQAETGYMDRQSVALQPDYYADLEKLVLAPRYTISAAVDPITGSVSGELDVVYTNTTQDTLSEVIFRLYPNANTIYGGGSLTVTQVTEREKAIQSELFEKDTALRVLLPQPLEPDQSSWLRLSFTTQVPAGSGQGYGIFSRGNETLFLAGWYPILAVYDDGWQAPPVPVVGDALLADTSLYEVNLTLPTGFSLISTGTLVATDTVTSTAALAPGVTRETAAALASPGSATGEPALDGETAFQETITWRLVSGPAREFAAAIVQDLETYETQLAGITLRLHTSQPTSQNVPIEEALQMLSNSFEAYLDQFGPYPFTEFDLVEAPISIGGYEFSGMVYVDEAVRRSGSPSDYEYLVAHEVAHQWWYGLVGNHTVNTPWLDEAHATYGPVIYRWHAGSPDAGERLVVNWIQDTGMRQPNDPPVNSSTLEFSNWSPYRDTVYVRGALFLHELRGQMGDEKFIELLRRFQETHRYKISTTNDYLRMAEEVAGRDLDPLFEKWFILGRTGVVSNTSPDLVSRPFISLETTRNGQ